MNVYPEPSAMVRVTCNECRGGEYVSVLYPAGFDADMVAKVRPLPCAQCGPREGLTWNVAQAGIDAWHWTPWAEAT